MHRGKPRVTPGAAMRYSSALPADEQAMALLSGTFIAVVGPSGAGKDSVLAVARSLLAGRSDVVFPRRTITRPADAGSEDHDSLDDAGFAAAEAAGRFALAWRAHGLSYGIPAAIDAEIAAGRAVVVNVSRTILPTVRARYEAVMVVQVTADRDVIAGRLARRGRESAAEIHRRLARDVPVDAGDGCVVIDNSGPLAAAGARLAALIAGTLDGA